MALNEIHLGNQKPSGIILNQTGGGIIVAMDSIAYSGNNATIIQYRDKRTLVPFRDKRTLVPFRDKREIS